MFLKFVARLTNLFHTTGVNEWGSLTKRPFTEYTFRGSDKGHELMFKLVAYGRKNILKFKQSEYFIEIRFRKKPRRKNLNEV